MRKVFVDVNCEFDPDGGVRPVNFLWEDGRRYGVDHIVDRRRSASLKTGRLGTCYTCHVLGRTLRLFREGDKWYLETPEVPLGEVDEDDRTE